VGGVIWHAGLCGELLGDSCKIVAHELFAVIIETDHILAATNFLPARKFKELCHDVHHRIIFEEQSLAAGLDAGGRPHDVQIVSPRFVMILALSASLGGRMREMPRVLVALPAL
jgi:hypothetical protein